MLELGAHRPDGDQGTREDQRKKNQARMDETGERSPRAGFLYDLGTALPGLIRSLYRGPHGIDPVPLP